mgnify:FL=1
MRGWERLTFLLRARLACAGRVATLLLEIAIEQFETARESGSHLCGPAFRKKIITHDNVCRAGHDNVCRKGQIAPKTPCFSGHDNVCTIYILQGVLSTGISLDLQLDNVGASVGFLAFTSCYGIETFAFCFVTLLAFKRRDELISNRFPLIRCWN